MIVLGSSGSIGTNTLKIAQEKNLKIDVLVAGFNHSILQAQINTHKPSIVCVATKEVAQKISHPKILVGEAGILQAIEESNSSLVVNALVGSIGLAPSILSQKLGKKLALANKESLVIGGKFLDTSTISPIDSEHFGIWHLLNDKEINRLIITASGGAFRDWALKDIQNASFLDSQKHPNWKMGKKITVDSASMANKLFEILECYWLFKKHIQNPLNIDAVIERSSIIHALIEYKDASTTAHFAPADMKLPISYAILGYADILPPLDLSKLSPISFEEISPLKYPLWQLKNELLKNPDLGLVVNFANEFILEKFFKNMVNFGEISKNILAACEKFSSIKVKSIDEIWEANKEIRAFLSTR